MILNQDKVPINLEDAIKTLKEGLEPADIETMKQKTYSPSQGHFSIGMALRNEWSLWEKDTILVQWFKKEYGLDHADDISGLILDCLYRDVLGEPRQDKALAKRFLDHWKKEREK